MTDNIPYVAELERFLEAAFRRGLQIVPLGMGGGAPLVYKGMKQADVLATSLDEVKEKWQYGTACGYGVICGDNPNGTSVIAIDVDLDVAGALDNFNKHDLPPTFKVKTPHGFHLYYGVERGKTFSSDMGSVLGSGVEIKGTNGRITGAGSKNRKGDYLVADNIPITPAPDWLLEKIEVTKTEPAERGEANYTKALEYVMSAPPAIEGQGGDRQTFDVAQGLIRHNLSRGEVEVLMRAYNERCEPMWDDYELEYKINSAFDYSTHIPSYEFDEFCPDIIGAGYSDLPLPTLLDYENEPPPEFVLNGILVRREITFLVAHANRGKTLVMIQWALDLARRGKRVLFMVGEAFSDFIVRTKAWRKFNELEEIPTNLIIWGKDLFPTTTNLQNIEKLKAYGEKFDAIFIDTFEQFLGGNPDIDSNSSGDMMRVFKLLASLADACDSSILCSHHAPRGNEVRIKGSTTIDGTAGIIFKLQKEGNEIIVEYEKNKFGSAGEEDRKEFMIDVVRDVETIHGLRDSLVATPRDGNFVGQLTKIKEKTRRQEYNQSTKRSYAQVESALFKFLKGTPENDGKGFSKRELAKEINTEHLPSLPITEIEYFIATMVKKGSEELRPHVMSFRGKSFSLKRIYDPQWKE